MKILINTPNGNIGRALVTQLLDAGHDVVGLQRSPEKVADLADRGATIVKGSVDDAATLDAAFEGVDAAFWLTPPAYSPEYRSWARGVSEAAAKAAKKHGVRRLVVLSSVGAQNDRVGPVTVLHDAEEVFREAGIPEVVLLRPSWFMENLFRDLETLRDGKLHVPFAIDRRMPWVATKDIASVAAEELQASGGGVRIRGVHGPADLSFEDVGEILSKALERDVEVVAISVDAAREGMKQAGLPAFAIDMFAEMYEGFGNGRMDVAEERTEQTTTPTTLAEFARGQLRPAL